MRARVSVGIGIATLAALTATALPGAAGFWISIAMVAAAAWIASYKESEVVVRLGGMIWTLRDFVRGWLITGDIGSGKTSSGIVPLMRQVFLNVPNWGGLCIDEKGVFWRTLTEMAEHHGRSEDVILLEVRPDKPPATWQPEHRLNLVGDRSIPYPTYARLIVEVAQALGQDGDQNFFREQAEIHIAAGLEALESIGYDVTLENACHLLTRPTELAGAVAILRRLNSDDGERLADHFESQLLQAPFEQRSGVTSTVLNYLRHFTVSDVAEVFCRDSTHRIEEVEDGKIFCLMVPHRDQAVGRYIGVLLKSLFYLHVLRRYNDANLNSKNLLTLWVDEAQRFVTDSKTGYGERSVLDLVREVKCAAVFATQSVSSLVGPLGRDVAKIVVLNLRNRWIFGAADQEDADEASARLGRRRKRKVSYTHGPDGVRRNVAFEEEPVVSPDTIRKLQPHECLLIHCRRMFRLITSRPESPDGTIPAWYKPRWKQWIS